MSFLFFSHAFLTKEIFTNGINERCFPLFFTAGLSLGSHFKLCFYFVCQASSKSSLYNRPLLSHYLPFHLLMHWAFRNEKLCKATKLSNLMTKIAFFPSLITTSSSVKATQMPCLKGRHCVLNNAIITEHFVEKEPPNLFS